MQEIAVARSEQDARAAAAVEQHHAEMAGALAARVTALVDAAAGRDDPGAQAARTDLVAWLHAELVPHAVAEEGSLYLPAQRRPEGRLLVDGMLADHRRIVALVEALEHEADPVRSAATGFALQALFDGHLAKENELVLPLLLADAEVSVADLLAGMHELLGAEAPGQHAAASPPPAPHVCGCGGHDDAVYPELDARAVPHAIRHATIFGALDAVRPGGGLVLVAPHDPLPLLQQVHERQPGVFTVDYVERGPEAWRLLFTR
jgi:uncharacterized protein (DUF2249 family)